MNRPQWCCALLGLKRRKRKDGQALSNVKQEEGHSPSSCTPEGAPPPGRRGPKQTPSAFLGTRCATHKEGTDDVNSVSLLLAGNERKRKSRCGGVHQAWESVSETCCQALGQSVRTNDWRETLNREIHPQKKNHHRLVDVVSSRPKAVGVLRPKPGVCRGRDPKALRQQRAPRQGLKLL